MSEAEIRLAERRRAINIIQASYDTIVRESAMSKAFTTKDLLEMLEFTKRRIEG